MNERVIDTETAANDMTFKKEGRWKEVWRRLKKDRLAMFGLTVISSMILLALLAVSCPVPGGVKMAMRLKLAAPSAQYWFGCDGYGRDLFARCLHGTQYR